MSTMKIHILVLVLQKIIDFYLNFITFLGTHDAGTLKGGSSTVGKHEGLWLNI